MERATGLDRYYELMEERPKDFEDNPNLSIITDRAFIESYEKATGKKIGVVYESDYHIMVVDLVVDADGTKFAYERILPVASEGACAILPIVNGHVLLLKQFRHAPRRVMYNIPRGFGDVDTNPPMRNALKELTEETGATVEKIEQMGTMTTDSGLTSTDVGIYIATISGAELKAGYESIEDVILVTPKQMHEAVLGGKITDSFTLVAWLLAVGQGKLQEFSK